MSEVRRMVRNFRGNVCFSPQRFYTPTSEEEVCRILQRHSRSHIRVAGALHSWSDVAASNAIVVDLRKLRKVEILDADHPRLARIGGGCRLKRALRKLARRGLTLPTLGAITAQSIAGAIATGTHGSGRPSLSHYVHAVRVAAYDEQGNVKIYEWQAGSEELRAARCALGCMGVVLAVTMVCVESFAVAQKLVLSESLEEMLAAEEEYPLQELALMPNETKFVAYQRRAVDRRVPRISIIKWLYRFNEVIVEDLAFHWSLRCALWLGPATVHKLFSVLPSFVKPIAALTGRWEAIDDSVHALTRRHDRFKHLEMEVLVPRSELPSAVSLVRDLIAAFAGQAEVSPQNLALLRNAELDKAIDLQRRSFPYFHHYPMSIRRVEPDDCLISMASDSEEARYSISFFTYESPKRTRFYAFYGFARVTAMALRRLYGGRLHWGKYFPLVAPEIAGEYTGLPAFRATCRRTDPHGVFQNEYTRKVLGFGDESAPVHDLQTWLTCCEAASAELLT